MQTILSQISQILMMDLILQALNSVKPATSKLLVSNFSK